VGVGSNISPSESVFGALAELERAPGVELIGISTFYRTRALPAPGAPPGSLGADPDYLNGVLALATTLDPKALSKTLEGVETAMGRARTGEKFAPRTMDLDLLLFTPAGETTTPLDDPPPHPEIRARPFVAIPLLELAPDLLLPPDGTPLRKIAASFTGPGGKEETAFTERLKARFLSP
jgi:2-amino-4-hydroxy-6-hydroxymethyldihydropteridine diphosphokinase